MIIESKKENYPYISPTPGEITIIAKTPYRLSSDGEYIVRNVFEGIVECGFNAVTSTDNPQNIRKCFEVMAGTGLKLIIGDQGIRNQYDDKDENKAEKIKIAMLELVRDYKDNGILGGYELKDEPKYALLPEIKDLYDSIKEVDSGHIIDINLACDFKIDSELGSDYLGPYKSYEEYLEFFNEKFTPALWSYDYYPIRSDNGVVTANDDKFFYFMQLFYDEAVKTGRPLWTYCMCMPYVSHCFKSPSSKKNTCKLDKESGKTGRPCPTVGELRFEAFAALAYGAQCISYWAYTQRGAQPYPIDSPLYEDGAWSEYYLSAPIELTGKRTIIWGEVQTVNKEIKAYNSVFCGCKVVAVMHAGKNYEGCVAFSSEKFGYLRKIGTMAMGVLVSHLKNGSRDYIVIVNHDPLHTQKISLEFIESNKVYEMPDMAPLFVDPDTGLHTRTLGPGGYAIFRVS